MSDGCQMEAKGLINSLVSSYILCTKTIKPEEI